LEKWAGTKDKWRREPEKVLDSSHDDDDDDGIYRARFFPAGEMARPTTFGSSHYSSQIVETCPPILFLEPDCLCGTAKMPRRAKAALQIWFGEGNDLGRYHPGTNMPRQ
jgi:hypothetical protein